MVCSQQDSYNPNQTDTRFFWLSIYIFPALWIGLALLAILRFQFIWLTLVVIACVLSATNGVAFSRADKFGNASNMAGSVMGSGIGRRVMGGVMGGIGGRFFGR